MTYLIKYLALSASLLSIIMISCSEQKEIPKPEAGTVKKTFSDPTKSMSNLELQNYDSIFNKTYSAKLYNWKAKYQDSLNCEIIFHTARDGYALCINFINFNDTSVYSMNLDGIIEDISEEEFTSIEKPLKFIYTRRIMNWKEAEKFDLRFSGITYQQYQFRTEE